jgi:hypothetical protein
MLLLWHVSSGWQQQRRVINDPTLTVLGPPCTQSLEIAILYGKLHATTLTEWRYASSPEGL